ncbi:hypothetical protein ACUN9V_03605 [Salinicola sp. V024]|uniref:hypothetical protein n=1 Tax=Salinicola sp. V024 TaxID=3459609 RepID=UPI004043DA0C
MPKPSIVVVIRRSRLSLAGQILVGLVLAGYAGWWLDYRVAVAVAFVAVGLSYRQYLTVPPRHYLRCGQANGHAVWESSADGRVWQSRTCQVVRLGPLLSAFDLSGQRLWLWPDSSDADSLRHLRETLSEQSERATG